MFGPFNPFQEGLQQEDPLGLGVAQRARDRRAELAARGLASPFNINPEWDKYHQAVEEAAGGRDVRYGAKFGAPGFGHVADLPAGMTEEATTAAAQQYAQGGALPDWYQGALPGSQEEFNRRARQALAGLRGAR